MHPPRRRARRVAAALAAVSLTAGVGAGIQTAHARSLGTLTSHTLLGRSFPADAITDRFDEPSGALNGTTDSNGDAWYVYPGTFNLTGTGQVVASGTALTMATVAAPGDPVDVSVGIEIHAATNKTFVGVLLNAAGTGTDQSATYVMYNASGTGTLYLYRISPTGVVNQLTLKNAVGSGKDHYLLATYINGVYTATLDGQTSKSLTYTVPAGSRTAYESNTACGIATNGDNSSTIDNFQCFAQ
jgi:hypothetical protein